MLNVFVSGRHLAARRQDPRRAWRASVAHTGYLRSTEPHTAERHAIGIVFSGTGAIPGHAFKLSGSSKYAVSATAHTNGRMSVQHFKAQRGRPRGDLPAIVAALGLEQRVLNQPWVELSVSAAQWTPSSFGHCTDISAVPQGK